MYFCCNHICTSQLMIDYQFPLMHCLTPFDTCMLPVSCCDINYQFGLLVPPYVLFDLIWDLYATWFMSITAQSCGSVHGYVSWSTICVFTCPGEHLSAITWLFTLLCEFFHSHCHPCCIFALKRFLLWYLGQFMLCVLCALIRCIFLWTLATMLSCLHIAQVYLHALPVLHILVV